MGSTGYQRVDSGWNVTLDRPRTVKGNIADRYYNNVIGFLLFLSAILTSLLVVDGILESKVPMFVCWAVLYSFYFIRIILFYIFTRKERPFDGYSISYLKFKTGMAYFGFLNTH